MKIQYAIDGALGEGIRVAHKIEEYVDIIEVGDGVLKRESLRAITLMKQIFPDKKILADLKLMDGGYTLGKEAYALGADIVTVCAAADSDCIAGLVRAAQEVGKESWVDLIGIEPRNYRDYVAAVNASGADYVCAHLSGRLFRDEPGIYARKDAIRLAGKVGFVPKLVLSGGLTTEYLPEILECCPHHVNLGGVLTRAKDPVRIAKAFFEA